MGGAGSAQLILQVLGVILGGGVLQIIIFLLKRRAELRALSVTTDATMVTAANALIVELRADAVALRETIAQGTKQLANLHAKLNDERTGFSQRVELARTETARLVALMSGVQTDLDIANHTIDRLRAQLRSSNFAD